ncbi:hypothetical protein PFISCL1PPCAC_18566, partial [Pristionchus fissidentatus]
PSSMVAEPKSNPISDVIEHSIRTVLAAPRERSLNLTMRINGEGITTSLQAVNEEEILEEARNQGVVDLVKRSRDVKRVRDACDVARQYYFEVSTMPHGGKDNGFEAISKQEMSRKRKEGRKIEAATEEKESWRAWASRLIRGATSRSSP